MWEKREENDLYCESVHANWCEYIVCRPLHVNSNLFIYYMLVNIANSLNSTNYLFFNWQLDNNTKKPLNTYTWLKLIYVLIFYFYFLVFFPYLTHWFSFNAAARMSFYGTFPIIQDIFSGSTHLSDSSTLILERVDRHHAGVYQCAADNGVREPVSMDINLTILCELTNIIFLFRFVFFFCTFVLYCIVAFQLVSHYGFFFTWTLAFL